jgi:hypothetical protein
MFQVHRCLLLVLLSFFVLALDSEALKMIFQMNLAAVFTAATQASWKRTKPVLARDTVILPALGFLGIILLW